MRSFGWCYEYLLWGISWLNISLMIADAPRTKEIPKDEDSNEFDFDAEAPVSLTTKDEIKNYLKGNLL